jgi:hypothetical protein
MRLTKALGIMFECKKMKRYVACLEEENIAGTVFHQSTPIPTTNFGYSCPNFYQFYVCKLELRCERHPPSID